MKTIKDILNTYSYGSLRQRKRTSNSSMQECFDFFSLIKKWKEIVGEKLAERTMPQGIYREKLVILTNHPAFAEQLSFMESILIDKVNKAFPSLEGKLKKITFKYDSQKFNQQLEMLDNITKKSEIKQVIHPLSPEYKLLRSKALDLLKDIDDEELKEQLISIYIQSAIQK